MDFFSCQIHSAHIQLDSIKLRIQFDAGQMDDALAIHFSHDVHHGSSESLPGDSRLFETGGSPTVGHSFAKHG